MATINKDLAGMIAIIHLLYGPESAHAIVELAHEGGVKDAMELCRAALSPEMLREKWMIRETNREKSKKSKESGMSFRSCGWCLEMNEVGEIRCNNCGHRATHRLRRALGGRWKR